MQHTSQLLMIRPVNFGFNTETAVNNSFQSALNDKDAQQKASKEFDDFVALLRNHDISIIVINDTSDPHTPDSIFPNNWISFHEDGRIFLYPMFAANRRLERKQHVIDAIRKQFTINDIVDLSAYEFSNVFLEGTGSMVLDRENRIAYACWSPRTDQNVLKDFCERAGYKAVGFHATDSNGSPVYHTNVMMCIADRFAVICLDSIGDQQEKNEVKQSLRTSGKEIVDISIDQMNHFAGNMLQVNNAGGQTFLVMSSQAYESLTPEQIRILEQFNPILRSDLRTIEANGGGSARCMMAEIFLACKIQH